MPARPPASRVRSDVTDLLRAWAGGDRSAFDRLVPIAHDELHRIARHLMRRERDGHTLQTTAVVNEAYLRLVDLRRVRWQDRAHFFAMSARVMRRILVDHARAHRSLKRSGSQLRVSLGDVAGAPGDGIDFVALHEALEALERLGPRKGRVVELRYFGGLTVKETAEVLQVSEITVLRDWRFAKAWLARELARDTA